MSFLTEFYLSNPYNPIIMILVFWLFWPGVYFIVSPVLESHPVYLGKGQSRMFFPGDFMLGIAIVMMVGMYAKNPAGWSEIQHPNYSVGTLLIQFIFVGFARMPDVARYPEGSRNSPTKLTHDICGYVICGWILIWYGIPELAWCCHTDSFGACATEWIVVACAAAFFIAMTAWDLSHPPTQKIMLLRHPDHYRPCWRK